MKVLLNKIIEDIIYILDFIGFAFIFSVIWLISAEGLIA